MSKIKIYVEGANDRVFLLNLLETVLGFSVSGFVFQKENVHGEILDLKGWGNLRKPLNINDFKENILDNIKNIIILDADNESNGGGFDIRLANIKATQSEFDLSFECFLMPNHCDDGSLETVLREMIKSENKPILDCLDNNDTCLRTAQETAGRELNLPNGKGKINYFKTLLKDKGNDYKNETIWDWEHPYLNDLKQFLEQHLS